MRKKATSLFLALALLFTGVSSALAAPEATGEWVIPFIGVLKVPAGFSAVEVKDFRSLIEKEKKTQSDSKTKKNEPSKPSNPVSVPDGTPSLLKDSIPLSKDAAMGRFQKADFAFYHLTMDDGNAIHMAWFLAARDGESLPPAVDVFSKELSTEQTQKLDELKTWVDANIGKAQYTDPKSNVSMKLIEMLPIQVMPMQEGQMWTAGTRALVTTDDMPFAVFARAYLLSLENRLTVGLLVGFDGERPFWDPVVKDAFLTLGKKTPAN